MFTFSFEWWNWPKYRIAKCQIVVFSITVSIIVQKLKFCKIEIEYTHITLLSAWDRSRDSTAKRTLSKHMWRSLASAPLWFVEKNNLCYFLVMKVKYWVHFLKIKFILNQSMSIIKVGLPFLNEEKFRRILLIFDIRKWLWKSESSNFADLMTSTENFQ